MFPATHQEPFQTHQLTGYLQGGKDDQWLVTTSQGLIKAKQAVSCLVQPALGDKVLLTSVEGSYYLLAILERQQSQAMKILAPEGLELDLRGQNCDWNNVGQWQLNAQAAHLHADETQVTTTEAVIKGGKLTQHWQRLHSLVEDFWITGQRRLESFKNSVTRIQGKEQKLSGHYLHEAEKSMNLRADKTSLTAKKDVRIDGKRINMG